MHLIQLRNDLHVTTVMYILISVSKHLTNSARIPISALSVGLVFSFNFLSLLLTDGVHSPVIFLSVYLWPVILFYSYPRFQWEVKISRLCSSSTSRRWWSQSVSLFRDPCLSTTVLLLLHSRIAQGIYVYIWDFLMPE